MISAKELFERKYILGDRIGEGAFATVYMCECKETKYQCAAKLSKVTKQSKSTLTLRLN